MARIKAFKGLRYNKDKVNYSDVVTQPYDKISGELQDEYYKKSEYTTAKLIKNKSDNPYQEAATFLEQWQKNGVLRQDDQPMLYAYNQQYKVNDEIKIRKGFIAMVGLEDYAKKVILPHERTLSKPKADRLNLLRATHAHLEQIFLLYSDPENKINKLLEYFTSEAPEAEAIDHFKDRHLIWTIDNQEVIDEIIAVIKDKQLFIADGHHRYETACNFAKENGAELGQDHPYAYCMATLINMEDAGLTILPTHRLLHSIKDFDEQKILKACAEYFELKKTTDLNTTLKEMAAQKNNNAFGFYAKKDFYVLQLKDTQIMGKIIGQEHSPTWQKLDVAILHTLILEKVLGISKEKQAAEENITYIRTADKAIEAVKKGEKQGVFLLNPTGIHQVRDVALAGDVMPQKSTDFYPKLLSGLVFGKIAR